MKISDNTGIICFDSGTPGSHLLISFLLHGNEYCGIASVYKILTTFDLQKIIPHGKITFVLGNIQAAYQGTRFMENDMNRVRDFTGNSYEYQRANEIRNIVDSCDICIDLHSTKKDSEPFVFSFAEQEKFILDCISTNYIMYDADRFLHGKSFASYCAESLGAKDVFVLEMGQHIHPDTFQRTYNNVIRILSALYGMNFGIPHQNTTIAKKLTIFSAIHAKTLDTNFLYTDTPKSFDFIPKNTQVCFDGEKVISLDKDCYIVLPSTPEYIGREIGYLANLL